MNAYEYLITKADDPALNGRVLAFAETEREAEAQLRSATSNESRHVEWLLVKTTPLGVTVF
jgi:hypothetical protein